MKAAVLGLLIVVGVAVAAVTWLRWMEPRMTYYPTRPLERTPGDLGWTYEEVWLRAADGATLHGWLVPAANRTSATPDSGGAPVLGAVDSIPPLTVILCHGNGGNISHRFEKLAILRELGAQVLIFDYRGYGRSEGRPSEKGLYRDVRAAYQLLRSRGVAPADMVLYGESLGGAVAVDLAAEVPVGGLVLEETFTSAADVAQATIPYLPARWWLRQRFDSVGKIGRVKAPVLVLHSRDDEYFPMRHAERLVVAARPGARLVTLRGGHNDAFLVSEREYRRALAELFERVRGARS
jgi:hypothetical protein